MNTYKILFLSFEGDYPTKSARDFIFDIQLNPAKQLDRISTILQVNPNSRDQVVSDKAYYREVATIQAEHLDHAYYLTQNIESSWNPPNRSSSVGDIFVSDDRYYVVDRFGFIDLGTKDDILNRFNQINKESESHNKDIDDNNTCEKEFASTMTF